MSTYPPLLKYLKVEACALMMDDGPLTAIGESCPEIECIEISRCRVFQNLSVAANFPRLRTLEVSDCDEFSAILIDDFGLLPVLSKLRLCNNKSLKYLAFDEESTSELASLSDMSVSGSGRCPITPLSRFAQLAPKLTRLEATGLPKALIKEVEQKVGPERMKTLSIAGNLMSDAIWNAKYAVFNKGGVGDPGMYGKKRGLF